MAEGLCRDTINCIVTGGGLTGWGWVTIQFPLCHDRRGLAAAGIVSRYSLCIVTNGQSG